MLNRQKTVLGLLREANRPLSRTVFVKLSFLLHKETSLEEDPTFYDFLPYKYGPFSFTLYRELSNLRQNGYVAPEENQIALSDGTLDAIDAEIGKLPQAARAAVASVMEQYGQLSQEKLVEHVYSKYPWYATKSQLRAARLASLPVVGKAKPAVYTAGYQGKSVDSFFNDILKRGIDVVIDVRANPISRKYGFSRRHLTEITRKLGLGYYHVPELGIPSSYRANLNGYESYQRLLNLYKHEMLPQVAPSITEVARIMRQKPSVLVCVEKDVRCCHRSRLAEAVSGTSGLKVAHL